MVHFGEFLKTWSLRSNRVTRQVRFNRTKIGRNGQNATFWVILSMSSLRSQCCKMRHFWDIFQHCDSMLNLHKLKLGSVGIFSNYCGSLIHTWWSCFWPCFDSLDTKLNDSQSRPLRTEKCPYLTSQSLNCSSLLELLKCTSTFVMLLCFACPIYKIPGHLSIVHNGLFDSWNQS